MQMTQAEAIRNGTGVRRVDFIDAGCRRGENALGLADECLWLKR